MSVGVYVTFGKFRTIHLGDLTKNKEFELMCPVNRIGAVDAFLGLHHAVNTSSSEVIVHALHPRAIIVNNGTRKGAQPDVMKVLFSSPGLEDLWQTALVTEGGEKDHNSAEQYIANLATPPPALSYIKLSANRDGSFTMTNSRNGFTKQYPARAKP